MTTEQAIDALKYEQKNELTCRFPCRAIMVKNTDQYCFLLSELEKIPGIAKVSSDELFSSADVLPRYENLQGSQYQHRWVILTGVSEYLRLFSKSEAESQRFAKLWTYKAPSNSTGRVIIPLWGCEAQWHDRSLHLCEDVRQEPYYYNCLDDSVEEQKMNIVVFPRIFEQYISKLSTGSTQEEHIFVGLQKWYEYWSAPTKGNNDQILLTKRYSTIQPTVGSISVHVVDSIFSFIREKLIGGNALTKDSCPEEASSLLFEYALARDTVDTAILKALNLSVLSGKDIMDRWKSMSFEQRQLVVLWFKLHPDNSYLCHCIQSAKSIEDIPEHVLHDIFAPDSSATWIKESQALIKALDLPKDDLYFEGLNNLPVYEQRLRYLTGSDKKERIHLLRLVGKWMREDPYQALSCETLADVYPELVAYLNGKVYDEDLRRYFMLYKPKQSDYHVRFSTIFVPCRDQHEYFQLAHQRPIIYHPCSRSPSCSCTH